MNIIITTDDLRRSFSINLRGWRAPVALLVLVSLVALLIYRGANALAERWTRIGDERVRWLVEEVRQRTDAERVELWNSTVARLDQEVTDLQVRLWRLTHLGNKIAERMGMESELMVDQEIVPVTGSALEAESPDARISELDTRLIELDDRFSAEFLRISQIGSNTSFASMQWATVPIKEPIEGRYWRTSGYGNRKDPFTGRPAFHSGYDFAARTGTPVLSAADGIVTHLGRLGNYGKTIEVYHGVGISTLYGHLSDYRVDIGDFVTRSQVIGLVGSTGRSTGPHLHYEVRKEGRPRPYSTVVDELFETRPLIAALGPIEPAAE